MTETITTLVSDRICNHMNKDHSETLVTYAEFFGQVSNIKNAKMLSIDNQAMYLSINDESEKIKIDFPHQLKDAKDAHHTLVEMLQQAKPTS